MTTNYRELFEESCKAYQQKNRLDAMAGKLETAMRAVVGRYIPEFFSCAIRRGISDSLLGCLGAGEEQYSQCCEVLDDELLPSDSLYDAWKNTTQSTALITEDLNSTYHIFCGENDEHNNGAVAMLFMPPLTLMQTFTVQAKDEAGNDVAAEVELFWENDDENTFFPFCDLCDALQHT